MRVGLLAAMIGLTASLVGAQPADLASAEVFYQRGRQAETLSDVALRKWVRTIRSGHFDNAVDRWVLAVDMYSNAVRYNPGHWRAQQRLGFLFADARGTHANDTLALLHLVAYLALQPTDAKVARAKELADQRLESVFARREAEKIRAEEHLDPVRVAMMGIQQTTDEYEAVARRHGDDFTQMSDLAKFTRSLPGFFAEQVNFNAELALQVFMARTTATAAPAAGMMGSGGMEGSGMAPAEGGSAAMPVDGGMSGGDMSGGGAAAPAATGALTIAPEADEPETVRNLAWISNYVPDCLAMMGGLHNFMTWCDQNRVAYDPRLCEGLIGECVVQLRRAFTRGRIRDIGQFRNEYQQLAKVGQVSVVDAWSLRDAAKELPEYLLAGGELPKPDADEETYKKTVGVQTVRLPQYERDDDPEAITDFCLDYARATFAAMESQKAWLYWRNSQLGHLAEHYGLRNADELLLRDFSRVGGGEMAAWPRGPLPVQRVAASEAPDRAWLASAE